MTSENEAEAIEFYTKQIEENPESIYPYVFRSACYESMGKYEEALVDALQIIENDNSYWKGHHQALKCQLQMKNIKEAREIVQKFDHDESFADLIEKFYELEGQSGTPATYQRKKAGGEYNNAYGGTRSSQSKPPHPYRTQQVSHYETKPVEKEKEEKTGILKRITKLFS
jgi:tetratricopeptide (TPR) repeat protein